MKRIVVLLAAAMLMAAPAFAAGTMSNVNQEVIANGANITSSPASTGGSLGIAAGGFGLSAEKPDGSVVIGEIKNKGGKMDNVNNKVDVSGATINANGAGVKMGVIDNAK